MERVRTERRTVITISWRKVAGFVAAVITGVVLLEFLQYLGDVVGVGGLFRLIALIVALVILLASLFVEINEEPSTRQLVMLSAIKALGPCDSLQISLETQRRLEKPIGTATIQKELDELVREDLLISSKEGVLSTYQITAEGAARLEEHIRSLTAKFVQTPGG